MYFKQVRLIKYRNFLDINLSFDRNLNIFIGENAQGKTNILEALNYIIKGNSYRTNHDVQLINWNNTLSFLQASLIKKEDNYQINIALEKKIENFEKEKINKLIKVNNKFKKKLFLNKEFKAVIFSPEHLQIIKGSPSLRRKFLNEQISQIYPIYSRYLSKYYRILSHRNNILKTYYKKEKDKNLSLWDSQLIECGIFIILTRSKFLKRISQIANKFHREITENKEYLNLIYQSNICDTCEFESELIREKFKEKLSECKEKELIKRTTLIGPHRDDFLVFINQNNVAFYGSQGQQRTSILSLKLAELDLIWKREGMYPILFLDDVMSELDEKRRYFLLYLILNKDIQTFITSISLNYFNKIILNKGKIFKINQGEAIIL